MPTSPLDDLRADLVLEAELRGRDYVFHSTWGLFSPKQVDPGTRLLVAQLPIRPDDDCLDVGCGYGPVGLVMARHAPEGRTLMVDKDFVAVRYALANAERNGLANAEALLSNGLADIDPALRFDLIASNLPAKVGRELLTLLVADAHARLRPGGRLCVVTINALRPMMKRLFLETFGNYDKLKQGPTHTVSLAERGA
jgi:16S rRNA G1207 methylase RsmC